MNLCLHEFELNKTALRWIAFQLLKCFLNTQESPLCYRRQTAVLVFSDALRPLQVLFLWAKSIYFATWAWTKSAATHRFFRSVELISLMIFESAQWSFRRQTMLTWSAWLASWPPGMHRCCRYHPKCWNWTTDAVLDYPWLHRWNCTNSRRCGCKSEFHGWTPSKRKSTTSWFLPFELT
jgi:putative component of membrane protein insertase Oxa1/YidC/SpoIIIJ protein YidD